MESRYRILSDNHILSCTPGTSMIQPHLGKSFCEHRLATRPHILLLAVVPVGIIQVFCSSHRFRLAHITAFLYKFSYGLRNRVSDNALCIVYLRNFWELVVMCRQSRRASRSITTGRRTFRRNTGYLPILKRPSLSTPFSLHSNGFKKPHPLRKRTRRGLPMKNGKTSGQHGPKHKGGAYHQLLPYQ